MPQIAYWISVFFGAGLVPFAPEPLVRQLALFLWIPIIVYAVWPVHLAVIVALFFLGLWASNQALPQFDGVDPSSIVVDEAVGMGISLLCVPMGPLAILLSFSLFRLFDIWKPWPIRQIEQRVKGGFGIMVDDVIAGVFALISVHLILRAIPW